MQPKDISKLKKQMSKACNAAINSLIEQLIYNEDQHKVTQSDPNATFQALDLNIKFEMNVQDKDGKTKPFQMCCNPTVKLK